MSTADLTPYSLPKLILSLGSRVPKWVKLSSSRCASNILSFLTKLQADIFTETDGLGRVRPFDLHFPAHALTPLSELEP